MHLKALVVIRDLELETQLRVRKGVIRDQESM